MGKRVSGYVIAPFSCWRCGRELAKVAGPGTEQTCQRCGANNLAPTEAQAAQIYPPSDATRPSRIAALPPEAEEEEPPAA